MEKLESSIKTEFNQIEIQREKDIVSTKVHRSQNEKLNQIIIRKIDYLDKRAFELLLNN